MRKTFFCMIWILCAVLLLSCDCELPTDPPTAPPTQATTMPTTLPPTDPPTAPPTDPPTNPPADPPTEPPTDPPTEPEHSDLYIPGVSVEDVILWFNEVCLDAEFTDGGDPSRLQKWTVPIVYHIDGEATEEDLLVLENFAQWLNSIEGFPGLSRAEEAWQANLRFNFCTQEQMILILGDNFHNMDGGVTFWYRNDEIYDATICYRTDIGQYLRNSVLLEELYNGLGPIQDTALRPDSIIYAQFSQPQSLTEIDRLILRLLYHPLMECGMNIEECESVIRELYY